MSYYIVAKLTIHDRERYAQYESDFMDVFSKFRGKLLAVDEQIEIMEGTWPVTRTVLIEFPTHPDALAWYQSDDYQAIAQHRFASSTGDIVLVRGLDEAPSQ